MKFYFVSAEGCAMRLKAARSARPTATMTSRSSKSRSPLTSGQHLRLLSIVGETDILCESQIEYGLCPRISPRLVDQVQRG
jgi:hypothetical protein